MADTLTSKGITLLDPLLNYDVNKFNANFQKTSDMLGAVVCTSTTRPSTGLYDGMTLWETDTRRFTVRAGGAWVTAPGRTIVADVAARNAIATTFDGQMVYRQDKKWHERYDGTAWRIAEVASCTSVADRDTHITHPFTGQMHVTTDTHTVWMRLSSGVWTSAVDRIIAYSQRDTASSGSSSSSALAVRRIDGIPLRQGCSYHIFTGTLHPNSSVTTDNVRIELRYNNAGVATTSSPVLPGALAYEAFGNTSKLEALYTPAVTENLSVLLCVARENGTGIANLYADATRKIQIFVRECPLLTNSGVNF